MVIGSPSRRRRRLRVLRGCEADGRVGLGAARACGRVGRRDCRAGASPVSGTGARPAITSRDGGGDARRIDQHRALERRREGMRERVGVQPADRRVELVVGELVHRLPSSAPTPHIA